MLHVKMQAKQMLINIYIAFLINIHYVGSIVGGLNKEDPINVSFNHLNRLNIYNKLIDEKLILDLNYIYNGHILESQLNLIYLCHVANDMKFTYINIAYKCST